MSDFITDVQCDEAIDYRPTQEDWAEYNEWLDSDGNKWIVFWQDPSEDEHIESQLEEGYMIDPW